MPIIMNYWEITDTNLSSRIEHRGDQIIDGFAALTNTHITIATSISAFAVGKTRTKRPQKLQPSTYSHSLRCSDQATPGKQWRKNFPCFSFERCFSLFCTPWPVPRVLNPAIKPFYGVKKEISFQGLAVCLVRLPQRKWNHRIIEL